MMRKTVKRKNNIRILYLVIFVCITVSIVLFGTPLWKVSTIEILGNEHYKEEEILAHSELAKGMHILQVQKRKVIRNLKSLPYIDTVEMNIIPPNGIKIDIIERKPIGYVPFLGTYLCIDKNGQVIDQQNVEEAVGLPIVEGLKFDRFTIGEVLDTQNEDSMIAIIEFATLMEKYNLLDKAVRLDVTSTSQIHLYIDTLDVIIGEMKDYDKKIQWLSKVLGYNYEMSILDLSNVSKGQAIMSPKM